MIDLFYSAAGEGQPVLIIHGWGKGGERWLPTARLLSKRGLRVIVPDLPGFGKTPAPAQPWGVADYVVALRSLLSRLGIDQVTIIGHSFGGQLAVVLAAEPAVRVKRLILVAPAVLRTGSAKTFLAKGLAKNLKPWLRPLLGERKFSWARGFVYRVLGGHDYLQAQDSIKPSLARILQEDVSAKLKLLSCPILLIWGDQDRQLASRLADRLVSIKPEIKLRIMPQAGHDLPFQQPERFIAEIMNWIDQGNDC